LKAGAGQLETTPRFLRPIVGTCQCVSVLVCTDPNRQRLSRPGASAGLESRTRVSPSAAPCVRRLADYAMENAREVRLIAHAASDSDRAEGLGGRQHQPLGHLNAPSQHIVARRCPKRTFERTAEVAGTEAHEPCELLNENPSGKIGFHMCDDFSHLPCRESSACDRTCFYVGWQSGAARTEARYSAKVRDSMRNVRACGFAVTIASSVCSFDELRYNDRPIRCQRPAHRRVL